MKKMFFFLIAEDSDPVDAADDGIDDDIDEHSNSKQSGEWE